MKKTPPVSQAVLITGCSSGIGRATARLLSARGHHVVASARRAEDVDALRAEGLDAVELDVADPGSIRTGLEAALELTGGRIDGLFNNAGYGQPGAVEDVPRDALRRQFETNLFGAHDLTTRVIPVMRGQGYGRIVQNSSLLGLGALPWRGAYNATKFALEGLSDTLRRELRGTGIHVVLVEPGPIATRFRENAYRAFREHIDADSSPHHTRYRAMERRLTRAGAAVPFTLEADAVARKVVHAVEARRPKTRYYVTVPTYVTAALRCILPDRMLDRVFERMGQ